MERNRCAEVVHAQLLREGMKVSLSTVKRVLDRYGLRKKKSKWKKYHQSEVRPKAEKPGILAQIGSIYVMKQDRKQRVYISTVIDIYSRWAYVQSYERLNAHASIQNEIL